jgi:hypothetical protein
MNTKILIHALTSLLMFVSCENENNEEKNPILESCTIEHLSFGACNSGSQKAGTPDMAAVKLSYLDSNLLHVELINTEFCCGTDSILILDSITNATIRLELIDLGPFTYCFCYHNVSFDLGPLTEGEYSLTFIESENAYKRDTLRVDFIFNSELDTTVTEESPPVVNFEEFFLEETIKGGCNEKWISQDELHEQPDTIIFTPGNDTLNVFVGVNYDCCFTFNSESYFNSDTLIIDLKATSDNPCDCICYYTFDFIYSGYHDQQFNYEVRLNHDLVLNGFYTPDF